MPAGSGRYPSGQRGQTVNLLAYAFGGSNPPLPTIVANGFSTAGSEGCLIEMGVAPTRPADRRRVAAARYAVIAAGASASRQCKPNGSFCGNSSAVERQPSKLGVAGSNPVSRSIVAMGLSTGRDVGGLFEMGVAPTGPFDRGRRAAAVARSTGKARGAGAVVRLPHAARSTTHSAHVAQLAEHALGKGEVSGSIPDMGSRFFSPTKRGAHGR